ncbi:hypothetical protein HBH56_061290 [Parastagonospora nodorum]|uniref:DUF7704 domain-containing protein n=1 Tax=Phaeosphaeria nodorum (strain SN15 / ATCC MYA-4574 / FGSC 10173) TaxID=321614 RepID=A0A7U2HV92_PHANO|nr:hypothetical protein HBH56_061290 [Parastagonospora nodorum]QRC91963.1 hypothetical protein JI435_021330 [Parastagonospora nodorum SN15]KAH3931092.1 hypothetical protein HBH54_105230 [Parastagonospora nodorum]KAH3954232.1 hypothetical protein HBH53_019910 [Parastagonospora nodorum]KAH3999966.1 hypothetical protein HBI10_107450 [Parastagonospora nodorum]
MWLRMCSPRRVPQLPRPRRRVSNIHIDIHSEPSNAFNYLHTMALGTNLPFWPAIVFVYFESTSILIGVYLASSTPADFISRQLPVPPTHPLPPHALIVSASIANMFLVQCMLSLLFTVVTRESKLTKYYLAAASVGDLGHMWANYRYMGSEVFWNWRGYNDMMFGNVVISAVFLVMRVGTLRGWFGTIGRGL